MKHYYFSRYSKYALGLFVFVFALSFSLGIGSVPSLSPNIVEAKMTKETVMFDRVNPNVRAVMGIQNRHNPDLMVIPEVVGTATGLTEAGSPAIVVFIKNIVGAGAVPRSLEGVPVVVKITGEILAMPRPPWAGGPGGDGDKDKVDPTKGFPRPVPVGISTGNEGECSSNNHVYALENYAAEDSAVLQPGRYDANCEVDPDDIFGNLTDFEELLFDGGDNAIDAAIASSSTEKLGNITPTDGYGTAKSLTVAAELGQTVQKYGRTTSLTKGEITGINATVNVSYGSGTARFVGQIIVSSQRGAFIKAGDSGSLLVTDPDRNPVGLLFAGNRSGKIAIANRIGYVLDRFGVTIDGE
jgi:hypothetical protein